MCELMTKNEVAGLLRVSPRTIERLVEDGKLPVLKVRRAVRFRRADVEQFVGVVVECVNQK
jgi:excisionase family DNA binding protein